MLPSSARRLDCVGAGGFGDNTDPRPARGDLEHKVETLESLPDRVTALEVQVSEFRAEVRAEFSATRTELRQEMRALNDETRLEMRALNDETRAQMRMLHEEVIARFNVLEEHPRWKRTTAPRPRKR
jgi:cell division protein FtsB